MTSDGGNLTVGVTEIAYSVLDTRFLQHSVSTGCSTRHWRTKYIDVMEEMNSGCKNIRSTVMKVLLPS